MPFIPATLCYLRHQGKTLMLEKPDGRWNGLGGKFEKGEGPLACATREVREESGLTVGRLTWHGFLDFPGFDGERDWLVWVYSCTEFQGTATDSPEGKLHWVDDRHVPGLNLYEGDRIFLPWIAGGLFFQGRFFYEGGKFLRHEVIFPGPAAMTMRAP